MNNLNLEYDLNVESLTEEELFEISAGGKCTIRKAAAEGAGGAIIGALGGPWGALAGGVTGVAYCYLDGVKW
ncbi:Blp family class II bacteriocin [Exiguobacterium sp. NG55]|uniref:Blp family class II bacteriocin n=1 Tax=Exiguobacterium sp. NG55 TaxID=375477 RepID=UPI0004DF6445|nr:Blp family class II bacteriocin [Exiguobacterium sp. NG55]